MVGSAFPGSESRQSHHPSRRANGGNGLSPPYPERRHAPKYASEVGLSLAGSSRLVMPKNGLRTEPDTARTVSSVPSAMVIKEPDNTSDAARRQGVDGVSNSPIASEAAKAIKSNEVPRSKQAESPQVQGSFPEEQTQTEAAADE